MSEFMWIEEFDDDDNIYWELRSPFCLDEEGLDCFYYRLRQRLVNNRIEWYGDHDKDIMGDDAGVWYDIEFAKSHIENFEYKRAIDSPLKEVV